jgi:hypothetical protein
VKCSLLTLSTFIDGELAPQRHAEVDAHLVGCTRCSAGAATLREEKVRVGRLARVTVDPGSAQLMLEQVGISIDSVVDRSPVTPPPPSAPADVGHPWQGGESSRALPWTPRRPEPVPIVVEPATVPPVSVDVQPDLPLDGLRSVPASWDKVVEDSVVQADAAVTTTPDVPVHDEAWVEADDEWLNAGVAPDPWEPDIPSSEEEVRPPQPAAWDPPAAPVERLPSAVPPMATPPLTVPPTRLAAASGPAALWTRVRDAVTVRLALARSAEALEDSAQIVSGAPTPRGVELPPAAVPDVSAPGAAPRRPAAQPPPEVELNGLSGRARPASAPEARPAAIDIPRPVVDQPTPSPGALADDHDVPDMRAPGWNAFAASSYSDADVAVDQPPATRPRPMGRHTRAVTREKVPLSTRVTRGLAAAAVATRTGVATSGARVRQAVGGISASGPDNRLLAGIAGIGLIFVIALLVGHSSAKPVAPTAARPSTAAPPTAQSHPSAPAKSSVAASAAGAPAPTPPQTFGAGDTGFQVERLRYGAQAGYLRVVFDLGAVGATASGTPKVTVAFTNPTTVLVTLNGTVPAGSTGTPTPGKVISSVTLVSSSGNKTVYRFGLTRAATATAFYLTSPTRFVLDLH